MVEAFLLHSRQLNCGAAGRRRPAAGPVPFACRRTQRIRAYGTVPGSTNSYLIGYPAVTPPASPLHGPVLCLSANEAMHEQPSNGNGGTADASAVSGALAKADFGKFVQFFRQASPYIAGHRGRTFVIAVPGSVTSVSRLLTSVMSDIALLHGLGIRLVVVAGIQAQIDQLLEERNLKPAYVGGYRVTDREALKAAIDAAGQVRTMCEQILSKGPAIPMIRRHTKGEREIHFEPAMRVVSGNYVTAKRRGVIDGVDFGYTGDVRFVLKEDIHRQLDGGNVVLLSNLGFTAAGEVLNCNTYDVALHAACELGADKLFFYHLDEVTDLQLPHWLPLSDAQDMLIKRLKDTLLCTDKVSSVIKDLDLTVHPDMSRWTQPQYPASPRQLPQQAAAAQAQRVASRLASRKHEELVVDLDVWTASGYPPGVAACVIACCKGVMRSHLLDARVDGGLLLELYSRDGVGTMISADFYEGIRKAVPGDLDGIQALLRPLEESGVLVKRSKEEVANMLADFTVLERENRVMGCALLLPLGMDDTNTFPVAELGAFCVDAAFRGSGRGDSLLDYVEQDARQRGVKRLVLLTTRTADWFEQRDFKWIGAAYGNGVLPAARRSRVNPARNSQLYLKELEDPDDMQAEPGKRIGF